MQQIKALNYSEDILSLDLNGEIQSVFDKTINILTYQNNLYTICKKDIFNAPRQIKLDNKYFDRLRPRVGFKVSRTANGICVNNNEIVLNEAQMFFLMKLDFPKIMPEYTEEEIEKIPKMLTNQLDTVGFFRKTYHNEIERQINLSLNKYSDLFICAIGSDSLEKIEESINLLIGLGSGLTPSGDDFLTGALLIINSDNFPFKILKIFVNDTVKKYLNKTNIISQNQLKLAMNGKGIEPIILFIDALYKGEKYSDVKAIISNVLMIGSSSGSDMLVGIIEMLEATIIKKKMQLKTL